MLPTDDVVIVCYGVGPTSQTRALPTSATAAVAAVIQIAEERTALAPLLRHYSLGELRSQRTNQQRNGKLVNKFSVLLVII